MVVVELVWVMVPVIVVELVGVVERVCRWHGAWTDTGRCSAATARRQAYSLLDLVGLTASYVHLSPAPITCTCT